MSAAANDALAPYSIEAEQMVVASLLIDVGAWERDRIGELRAEDFYNAAYGKIFEAARALYLRGDHPEVVMVAQKLKDEGNLDYCGGLAHIGQIANAAPSTANVSVYAEIIINRAGLRNLMSACGEIADGCRDATSNAQEQANQALSLIGAIADGRQQGGMEDFRAVVADTEARVIAGERKLYRGMFPVRSIERVYGALEPGQLIIVAARPAMGKTVFGLQAGLLASRAGFRTAFFEAEMSSQGLASRALSAWSDVPLKTIRFGDCKPHTDAIRTASARLQQLPMKLNATPGIHIDALRAQCRALSRRAPLNLIVVDHLGLIRGDGKSSYETTKHVSNTLKVIAKENDAVVMALVQLNRGVESRADRRPTLADLRDSGSIEEDADGAIMLYRDNYYNPESPAKGVLEMIVRKNRDGELGTAYARTAFHVSRFDDVADDYAPAYSASRDSKSRFTGESHF